MKKMAQPDTVYFCGSIKGGRQDRSVYEQIIRFLSAHTQVLTEHIADPSVGIDQHLSDRDIHDRDMHWLRQADLVIAEVTQPSLGVGYEIGRALEWGKPIIVLYRQTEERKLSAMIAGCAEISTFRYTDLDEVFAFLTSILQTD